MFKGNKKNARLYFEIIRQLYYGKSLSCAELSALTDRSIPLITKAVNHLIAEGLVREVGLAPSSGGRRPLVYAIIPKQLYIVAVAMDQLNTRLAIIDLDNSYAFPVEDVPLKLQENPDSLDQLTASISAYIKRSGIPTEQLIGVGIGMPGFVDVKKNINYSYLHSGNKSIVKQMSKHINLPIFIDNDSSLIALSELRFGMSKDIKHSMVVNLGWGIGLGMIINGELYRGNNGFAGEFSHNSISEDGLLCVCGKRGCLEAEASILAVSNEAIQGLKEGKKTMFRIQNGESGMVAGNKLIDIALKGDQYAVELLSEAGYKIGKSLSVLIHIINPKAIILSGQGARIGRLLLAPIQQALNKYSIPRLADETEIFISDIGFDAELIGAAILVMESYKVS